MRPSRGHDRTAERKKKREKDNMRWIQTELESDPSRIGSVLTLLLAESALNYDPTLLSRQIWKTTPSGGFLWVSSRHIICPSEA